MVSGSPDISNSFIFLYSISCVSHSGWWCPALWLSVFTCRRVVFQLSPRCLLDWFSRCGFPRCGLPVAPRLLRLLSRCVPLVSEGWFPNCLPIAFHHSHVSPELIVRLSPRVFHLSPRFFPVVFQDVVSHLSPSYLVVSRLSCKCGLPIISEFVRGVLS